MTEYCAVIGPAFHSAGQQTAVKEVTRPLPSLAERGVAMRDYSTEGVALRMRICIPVQGLSRGWHKFTPFETVTS